MSELSHHSYTNIVRTSSLTLVHKKVKGFSPNTADLLMISKCALKARSHQIKIATDWLQTGFRLASDSIIGVNGAILYQCNPIAFYQSEASWKPG